MGYVRRRGLYWTALLVFAAACLLAAPAFARHQKRAAAAAATSAPTFKYGQMQDQTVGQRGCGTNIAGEPAIHVSRADNVFLGSEVGIGSGSELWRGIGASAASACGLEYRGQPNAVAGVGLSGGDIDVALASAKNAAGNYNLYVASLNLASVSVAHSTDNGQTFQNVPVVAGLPGDDREWIAAYGASTALLSYHDLTGNIDILRSDNGGTLFTQIAQVAPSSGGNQHGNLVIDHTTTAGTSPGPSGQRGFWAYQSFVDTSDSNQQNDNEAFVAVSHDGGYTWQTKPVPCSITGTGTQNGLAHNFPNISVDPQGRLWYAWSDDRNIYTATSSDHGSTWSCSGPVSTNTSQAIFPWLVATSAGVDLVYYGMPAANTPVWYVYFAQRRSGATSFGVPQQLVSVHKGAVCESGATCSGGRQLFDDFGVDTDSHGLAHIAYSHDSPDLGGSGTYTGYAVQTGGATVGSPNR